MTFCKKLFAVFAFALMSACGTVSTSTKESFDLGSTQVAAQISFEFLQSVMPEPKKPDKPKLNPGEHYFAHIKFDTGVDDRSVEKAIREMGWAKEDDAEGIIFEIDSPGGMVDAGFKLGKKFEESEIPVHCVVDGDAASMAMYILQSCTTRAMTPRSQLMFHQPSISGLISGRHNNFKNLSERLRTLESAMVWHVVRRSKVSPKEMKARISGGGEWWFDAEEAGSRQFVDSVYEDMRDVLKAYKKTGCGPKKL
jgi:ATP-dependent Clp protease protease subunit